MPKRPKSPVPTPSPAFAPKPVEPAKTCAILPDTTLGDDVALVAENMEAILASTR
jgi:hypothetical protein